MLTIQTEVISPFQQNCRILVDDGAGTGVIIDPGDEVERLQQAVEGLDISLSAIVLTHSHIDHAGGVAAFQRLQPQPLPLFGHPDEAAMRRQIPAHAEIFGLDSADYESCPEPSDFLADGDTITVGELSAQVLFTPGHSPGHLAFYFEAAPWRMPQSGLEANGPILIAGDTLFAGSIGRTDLPGGDHGQLIQSIREKLLVLPDDTRVLCGHGPDTTIGEERRSNPFLQ